MTIQKIILFCTIFCLYLPAWAQNTQVRYAIIPENPVPGEPVTVAIDTSGVKDVKTATLSTIKGKKLARALFFKLQSDADNPPVMAAVLAVPNTAEAGFASISIEGAAGVIQEIPLVIRERKFNSETVELNEALTGLRVDPDPVKTKEAEQLWAILNKTGTEIYNAGAFSPPVTSTRRTSFFGDRRVYQYSNGKTDTTVHAGIDYGVPTGTPVRACAAGKVILAKPRIVTGNSVVIEHAPGIYSLYYHMSKIVVAEGAMVQAGTLLGESGSTGLATGPHLHWEIRVSGESADPDICIARPLLDKEAILAIINNETTKN